MSIEQPQSKINPTALVHARELSDREFHEAVRDLATRILYRRPPLPSVGELLRQREARKENR